MARNILELDRRHIWHPFTQAKTAPDPLPIVRAQGLWLETADGRRVMDMISSWWTNIHGHGHPALVAAIAQQAAQLDHVMFAGLTHQPAVDLAKKLAALTGLSRVFFSDDGSTAVEVALKLARQYWVNRGEDQRRRYIALEGAYHGDTFGAMAVGASSGFYPAFDPLLMKVATIPFPEHYLEVEGLAEAEAKSLDQCAQLFGHNDVAAIILEPLIQGAAGMRTCRREFVEALVKLAKDHQVLVIFDEVMTGFGRTGELFVCQNMPHKPDFLCLSKGLTGGLVPMSVTLCSDDIYDQFMGDDFSKAFAHGHSYTANAIACALANASLLLFDIHDYPAKWREISAIHQNRLARIAQKFPITKPRFLGTMAAFTWPGPTTGYGSDNSTQLRQTFLSRGCLIRPLGPELYLLPPYCITTDELNLAWDVIEQVLEQDGQKP